MFFVPFSSLLLILFCGFLQLTSLKNGNLPSPSDRIDGDVAFRLKEAEGTLDSVQKDSFKYQVGLISFMNDF